MSDMTVYVRRLSEHAEIPRFAHDGDAGADLVATEDLVLKPGQRALVSTGIAIAIPEGYVGLVHPRSGLAAQHGISVVNAPGTIDAGYRGEVKVILVNLDPDSEFRVEAGDRIAQLVIQKVERPAFVEAGELPDSARGAGGFGSTGGNGSSSSAG
jgi:dUTP pyrophosphatase